MFYLLQKICSMWVHKLNVCTLEQFAYEIHALNKDDIKFYI